MNFLDITKCIHGVKLDNPCEECEADQEKECLHGVKVKDHCDQCEAESQIMEEVLH